MSRPVNLHTNSYDGIHLPVLANKSSLAVWKSMDFDISSISRILAYTGDNNTDDSKIGAELGALLPSVLSRMDAINTDTKLHGWHAEFVRIPATNGGCPINLISKITANPDGDYPHSAVSNISSHSEVLRCLVYGIIEGMGRPSRVKGIDAMMMSDYGEMGIYLFPRMYLNIAELCEYLNEMRSYISLQGSYFSSDSVWDTLDEYITRRSNIADDSIGSSDKFTSVEESLKAILRLRFAALLSGFFLGQCKFLNIYTGSSTAQIRSIVSSMLVHFTNNPYIYIRIFGLMNIDSEVAEEYSIKASQLAIICSKEELSSINATAIHNCVLHIPTVVRDRLKSYVQIRRNKFGSLGDRDSNMPAVLARSVNPTPQQIRPILDNLRGNIYNRTDTHTPSPFHRTKFANVNDPELQYLFTEFQLMQDDQKSFAPSRIRHCSTSYGHYVFLYGGFGNTYHDSASDIRFDLWIYNTRSLEWAELRVEGKRPSICLDCHMFVGHHKLYVYGLDVEAYELSENDPEIKSKIPPITRRKYIPCFWYIDLLDEVFIWNRSDILCANNPMESYETTESLGANTICNIVDDCAMPVIPGSAVAYFKGILYVFGSFPGNVKHNPCLVYLGCYNIETRIWMWRVLANAPMRATCCLAPPFWIFIGNDIISLLDLNTLVIQSAPLPHRLYEAHNAYAFYVPQVLVDQGRMLIQKEETVFSIILMGEITSSGKPFPGIREIRFCVTKNAGLNMHQTLREEAEWEWRQDVLDENIHRAAILPYISPIVAMYQPSTVDITCQIQKKMKDQKPI